MKTLLSKARLFALLLAVAFLVAACGGAGGPNQGSASGSGGHSHMDHSHMDHSHMDHSQMDHGSMDMGSGAMARQMVMDDGKYSDEAFIDAMVPHHQGAIEMAEVALQNAKHEEIKQLSRNIISSQQAEIKELKAIKQQEFGTSEVPMEVSAQEMQMMGMTDPEVLANKDPFDKAFIDAMVPHHESAIEMAQVAYRQSDNPKIKKLAEGIVEVQTREITRMEGWRQQWYPEG